MANKILSPEGRRLMILRGIDQDLTNLEIATKMGIKIEMIKRDIKVMKVFKDFELLKAYSDKKKRALVSKQKPANERNARFKRMTGRTFQEKNFENMVNYYRPELIEILGSTNETAAIMGLPKSVLRSLTRNNIIDGLKFSRQISSKALDYLQLVREL